MLTSTNLATVPFISSTDATRLQMAAKQLSQAVTHFNCKVPYVIGKDWTYLRDTTKLFRYEAIMNGEVVYKNDELMIVLFENNTLKLLDTPEILHTNQSFCTQMRYRHELGKFNKYDTIYEYDCFINGVPSFGYNINLAFMPFFGMNFEDSIVTSEAVSDLCRSTKTETIIIPIYVYSLFKNLYPNSKYKFIPETNQSIKKNILATQYFPKTNRNIKQFLRSMNIYDFNDVINDELQFNSNSILCKLKDAKISELKIHKITKKVFMIDKTLQKNIESILTDYRAKTSKIFKDIHSVLGEPAAKQVLVSNYVLTNPKEFDCDPIDLAYIIEIKLVSSLKTKIGDKLTNRYSNKGVISCILPDELRPLNQSTHEPIDLILGPLSIFSRMNFGQILEILISKVIRKLEKKFIINQNEKEINIELKKLAKLAIELKDPEYSIEILNLADKILNNSEIKNKFIEDITNGGMYFECKGFIDLNIDIVRRLIFDLFGIRTNDEIRIRKETFAYIKDKVNVNINLPNRDIIYDDIFNGPGYILKLKHLGSSKLSVRDYGDYNSSTKQPIADKFNRSRGSRLGYMEFDGLLAHNVPQTIREFRTVKSDSSNLKSDLINQIISTGEYKLPINKTKSYTKLIIDSLIKFLNQN